MRPERGSTRIGALAAASVVAALVVPASAGAQATFSASCTPTTIAYPGSTTITCALAVTTAAQEERFTVSTRVPQFGGEGQDAEFATLATNGQLTLNGPGALGLGAFSIPSIASCGGTGPGWHGSVNGGGVRDVTIPAGSQSSLVATFVANEPPWPGDSIAPFFEIGTQMVSGDESTLPLPLTVRTAEPARTGMSGLRILFKTRPESERAPARVTEAKLGKAIVVTGRTEPVLRRKILKLRIVGPITSNTKVRPVKQKVRTGRRGFFETRFTPESVGAYEIAMSFNSKSSSLADGYTCSRFFDVTK